MFFKGQHLYVDVSGESALSLLVTLNQAITSRYTMDKNQHLNSKIENKKLIETLFYKESSLLKMKMQLADTPYAVYNKLLA